MRMNKIVKQQLNLRFHIRRQNKHFQVNMKNEVIQKLIIIFYDQKCRSFDLILFEHHFFIFLENNNYSKMKNFQGWLDFQLYNSHLKNLTKIKQQSLYLKNSPLRRKQLKTANHSRMRQSHNGEQVENRSKNHFFIMKLQRKQNEINQQNLNLANRLINVSSVISKDKQVQSYRRYQSIFRRNSIPCNQKVDFCRARKLKKFMKMHENNYMKGIHKNVIKIRFMTIPKIPLGRQPTFWVELHSGLQKISSNYYSLDQFLANQIKFPLRQKVDKNIMIYLNCSRGLDYISLGKYFFQTPKEGICTQYEDILSTQDPRKIITINVQVENLGKVQKYSSLHVR